MSEQPPGTVREGDGLRIGLRVNTRTSGGGVVFNAELAKALVTAEGCAGVTLFVLGDLDDLDVPPGARVVPVTPASSAVRRRMSGTRSMEAALRKNAVDVLICPGTELTRTDAAPTIFWPLTVAPFEPETVRMLGHTALRRLRWVVLRQAIRASCRRADAFVFSSHYARSQYLQKEPSIARRPNTVIRPGPSLHPPDEGNRPSRPDVPSPYLLYVSHLYPYKMVTELIDGFARLAADLRFTEHLVVAGRAVDAAYERRVYATIREHGLQDRVHLVGAVDKRTLEALYCYSEAFLFPSLSENAGSYALVDAFVYGKPVISSSTSSMPEICQGAARYVDPRDPEHVADQIAIVAADSVLREELADRSRRHAQEFPGWEEIARTLIRFAQNVARGASSPPSR